MRLTITEENHDAWLAMRRETIGASEAPAALGLSRFETPLSLYLRKIGATPDVKEENEAMYFGTKLEPFVLDEYERRSGRKIAERQVYYRGEDPRHFMSATVDALTADGIVVEAKTVGAFSAKELGIEGSDEIPEPWLVQAHQQMILTGAKRVDFPVLVGGQSFRMYQVDWNPSLAAAIDVGVEHFWKHVTSRIPPPVDPGRDGKALAILYRQMGPTIEADKDLAELTQQWEETVDLRKGYEKAEAFLKARLLEKLGENSAAILLDGRILKRSVTDIEATVVHRKAHTQVRLSVVKG